MFLVFEDLVSNAPPPSSKTVAHPTLEDERRRGFPLVGRGKEKELGFFLFGCARGFGWWEGII
jgi:hypothetical protein